VPGANRLKFTPDGRHVLITAGSALVVLDSATRKEVKRLATVHGSGGIQMGAAWRAGLCGLRTGWQCYGHRFEDPGGSGSRRCERS